MTTKKAVLKSYEVCPYAGAASECVYAESHQSQPGYLALYCKGEMVAAFWGVAWFKVNGCVERKAKK